MRGGRSSHFTDIEVFCHAAETRRFAVTADALQLPPSSVSRAIQRLEARLGVPLFTRTTRQVTLTDEGALLHRQARAALQQIEDVEQALIDASGRPKGSFRIALPTTYGNKIVLPAIPTFLASNPDLELEIHVTNRVIDLIEEGFDLVVRLGEQPSSALLSRTLTNGRIGIFAAASYVQARGAPEAPEDIPLHRCVRFVYPGTPQALPFVVIEAGAQRLVEPGPGPTVVGDPMGMISLGLAGAGLFQTGRYLVEDELAKGDLVEVLGDWSGATRPIVAMYPANRRLSAKVRAFMDWFG